MVADFSKKAVDMSKVALSIQQFVSDVAKQGGKKKKIDTESEFYQLSERLANFGQTMNNDERNYIEGFMIDYQQEKAKEFEDLDVTKHTKKEVNNIKKRMGNKNKIDTDEEAIALVNLLKDSHGDLNQADRIYIENLLIKSEYSHYIYNQQTPNSVDTKTDEMPKECQPIETEKSTDNKTNSGEETVAEKTSDTPPAPKKIKKSKGKKSAKQKWTKIPKKVPVCDTPMENNHTPKIGEPFVILKEAPDNTMNTHGNFSGVVKTQTNKSKKKAYNKTNIFK